MVYEPHELVRLAEAYAAAKGRALQTIGAYALGRQNLWTFRRLKEGHGCNLKTAVKASRWFDANAERSWWPEDLPWPTNGKGVESE